MHMIQVRVCKAGYKIFHILLWMPSILYPERNLSYSSNFLTTYSSYVKKRPKINIIMQMRMQNFQNIRDEWLSSSSCIENISMSI